MFFRQSCDETELGHHQNNSLMRGHHIVDELSQTQVINDLAHNFALPTWSGASRALVRAHSALRKFSEKFSSLGVTHRAARQAAC